MKRKDRPNNMWFLLILVALPMIEIALFITVGDWIGLWPTLGLVVLSAVLGFAVMKRQGIQALERLRLSMEAGGDPSGPMAHGALIMIAGVLLILPGFFTDSIGIALLIPPVRGWVISRGAARVTVRATSFASRGGASPRRAPDVIDADYEVVEDETPARTGRSGWTKPRPDNDF